MAHRQELVSQISLSLARYGVRHNIVGPKNVIKWIIQLQREETGGCFYEPASQVAVAGVDTLVRRGDVLRSWLEQVTLGIMDEGHHPIVGNKWANARILGVTATPCRADGKGLGRHADGIYDALIEGPTIRELIAEGHLSDYRILCPPSDIDLTDVGVSRGTGDFNPDQLRQAARRSHLVGDVVATYLRVCPGALGITFATDVEMATDFAAQFNRAGVPAAVVSAKTPGPIRQELIKRFRRRDLLQLVNVDIFGEGFDLPALEVVSFARPTASYPLFCQQFGRVMRPFEGKKYGWILDHVGNVVRHNGPPDVPRVWSLDRRDTGRRGVRDPDIIPQKICVECTAPYEAVYSSCPYCGFRYVPARRDGPTFVEGDLIELDAATLAALRGEVANVDESPRAVRARMVYAGASALVANSASAAHRRRQDAQYSLRRLLSVYGGQQRARGRSDSEAYRRFFFRYDVDILSAQALGRADAENLSLRIINDINGRRF